MIQTDVFFKTLVSNGVDFFSGVPDSLLKDFCAYLTKNVPNKHHIIAANEGGAVALGVGFHLATGKIPLIYMQNSGLGNAINPLMSIADPDVYSIPLILLIGWRGEPGVKDEPQHAKQGPVTLSLLEAMGIPYVHITDETKDVEKKIETYVNNARHQSRPVAIIISKGTFSQYFFECDSSDDRIISRENAIESIITSIPQTYRIVSTTGMASRELYELRDKLGETHSSDFLNIGGMGHSSHIAAALSLFSNDKIICLDGDGAVLMHMGSLAINGTIGCNNLIHVVLNNGAHDSVGGQPTVGLKVKFTQIAKACGYSHVCTVSDCSAIQNFLKITETVPGPHFLEIIVSKGARKDLGRPKEESLISKEKFMRRFHEAD